MPLWSIFWQAAVLKAWCKNCIAVQAAVICCAATVIAGGNLGFDSVTWRSAAAIPSLFIITVHVLPIAFEYYKKAIAVSEALSGKGHFTAMSNLGAIYAEKTDSEEDGAIAFELLRSASESGEAVPLLNLALCYEHGKGCAKDILTAAYYYERSGSAGSAKALYRLGLLCITHYEMPSQKLFSVEKAVEYFERAGSMGISDAYCELADIYGSDEYGKYDEKKVITYYKKASDLGSDVAAYQLANRYLKGKGVEKDEKTAMLLLKKAALRGYKPAQNQLRRLTDKKQN
jgi:TPR repeat protein